MIEMSFVCTFVSSAGHIFLYKKRDRKTSTEKHHLCMQLTWQQFCSLSFHCVHTRMYASCMPLSFCPEEIDCKDLCSLLVTNLLLQGISMDVSLAALSAHCCVDVLLQMTNGQQLEMVDGTLVETTAPTIQVNPFPQVFGSCVRKEGKLHTVHLWNQCSGGAYIHGTSQRWACHVPFERSFECALRVCKMGTTIRVQ